VDAIAASMGNALASIGTVAVLPRVLHRTATSARPIVKS